MDSLTLIAVASIVIAGLTTGFGTMGPALAEGRAVATALTALAQQPDASATITRTLFVGLAMIESTAIYCFVVSMILIFSNPFWSAAIATAATMSSTAYSKMTINHSTRATARSPRMAIPVMAKFQSAPTMKIAP